MNNSESSNQAPEASTSKCNNEDSHHEPEASTSKSISPNSNQAPEASTSSASLPLDISKFRFLAVLGRGAYGQVWFAHALQDNTVCAIKVIRRSLDYELCGSDGLTDFEREVACMKRVDPSFPFIVRIFGNFSTPYDDFLVMEYLGCGDMYDHLHPLKPLSESPAKLYTAELGSALQHLHDHKIIYRDLKLENVMLAPDGHLKLVDFGLSKVMTTETTGTPAGSTITMAPEILLRRQYNHRADWYSLGVVLYEMLTGDPPFFDKIAERCDFETVVIFTPIPIPSNLTLECQDLLKVLLKKDPKRRLVGFRDLLRHDWFQGYSPQEVLLKSYKPEHLPSTQAMLDLSKFEPSFKNPDAEKYYRSPPEDYMPPFRLSISSKTPSAESTPSFSSPADSSPSVSSAYATPPDVSPADVPLPASEKEDSEDDETSPGTS